MLAFLDREFKRRVNVQSATDARGWSSLFNTGYFRDKDNHSDPIPERLFLPYVIDDGSEDVAESRSNLSNATKAIIKEYLHSGILQPRTVGLLMAAFPEISD